MKKIAFIFSLVLISLFSTCNATNDGPSATTMARQFAYYVAHGDAIKASLSVTPETDITNYVTNIHSEIEQLGGLEKIVIKNEETVNENKVIVTLAFVCKKEGASIEKTYTLLLENNTWKIATDKL